MHSRDRLRGALLFSPGPLVALTFAVGITILCVEAWRLSLAWPTIRDLPIMLYMSFLWDRYGVLPHAGFFDMNLLGSYLSYLALGKLFGYHALGVRWADFSIYLVLAALTVFAMRRVGQLAGWIAAVLFGIVYLQAGPSMSLQREYLMLVPLVMAVAAATLATPVRWRVWTFATGVCVGTAMTIKPQAIVATLPLAAFLSPVAWDGKFGATLRLKSVLTVAAWMACGTGLLLAALLGSLALLGVLDEFLDIASNYLPLYASLTGTHDVLPGEEQLGYLLKHGLELGRHYDWLLGGAIGALAFALGQRPGEPGRRLAGLFFGLSLAFAVYPTLAGKFWTYHWLPMLFWLVVCASLALAKLGSSSRPLLQWAAVAVFALLFIETFPPAQRFGSILEPSRDRPVAAEQISNFLNDRLLPGDTVQPMDWTKGEVVHGLLRAEAELATSFIYDFHFYHHVSNPYIRALRRRFLRELEASNPRFIVRSRVGPFPVGRDTNRKFEGFRRYLKERYRKVADARAYAIFELRPEFSHERSE